MGNPVNTDTRFRFFSNVSLKAGTLVFFLISLAFAQEPSSTPLQVMTSWLETYPAHLDRAVELTTPRMRKFLTPRRWVATTQRRLGRTGFRYVKRKIVSVRSTGSDSIIVVQARALTPHGETRQRESYTLKPFCTTWLIDSVRIIPDGVGMVER